MKDKILIYNDFQDLKKKCKTCFKRDHDIFICPEIHYVPRQDFIIRRHLFNNPHLERGSFHRIDRKRHNALKILNTLQEKMSILENMTLRQEDFFNEESIDEFSEIDFNEIAESPPLVTEALTFKLQSKSMEMSGVIKPELAENVAKMEEEKEKDKLVNFEDELINKKKKESLTNDTDPQKPKRSSKIQNFKQMNLGTTGSIKSTLKSSTKEIASWDNDFERMHIFTRYWANDNADLVLKNYELFMTKKAVRIQKLRNMKRKNTIIASSPRKFRFSILMKGEKKSAKLENDVSPLESPNDNPDRSITWNLEDKIM